MKFKSDQISHLTIVVEAFFNEILNSNDFRDQFLLGSKYLYGDKIPLNLEKAFQLLKKSSEADYLPAKLLFADCLCKMNKSNDDLIQAFKIFSEIAKCQYFENVSKEEAHKIINEARVKLAYSYQYGFGTKPDLDKSIRLYRSVIKTNENPRNNYFLAECIQSKGLDENNIKEVLDILIKLIKTNDINYSEFKVRGILAIASLCKYNYSLIKKYLNEEIDLYNSLLKKSEDPYIEYLLAESLISRNSNNDIKKALKLFEKLMASNNSNPICILQASRMSLATIYHQGILVNQNLDKAIEIYESLINDAEPIFEFSLADCLLEKNSKKDKKDLNRKEILKALKILTKSTKLDENMYPAIVYNSNIKIAKIYREGKLVAQDVNKVIKIYEKYAEVDDIAAMYELALIYGSQDEKQSIKYYEKIISFEKLHSDKFEFKMSLFNLGLIFSSDDCDIRGLILIRKAASLGLSVAQFHLATILFEADAYDDSIKWLVKALKNSYYPALEFLHDKCSEYYKNDEQIFKWLEKFSNAGYEDASCRLGYCYKIGKGTTENNVKARKIFHELAIKGHFIAQYHLGKILFKLSEHKEAIKWLTKSIEKDHYPALVFLQDECSKYYKNDEQIFKWLEKFVDKGLLDAQRRVADHFRLGKGVDLNYDKARKIYLNILKHNKNSDILISLGIMYYRAQGVDKDTCEAIKYFNMAGDDPRALCCLGLVYLTDKNHIDTDEGTRLLKLAISKGNKDAEQCLKKYELLKIKLFLNNAKENFGGTIRRLPVFGKFTADVLKDHENSSEDVTRKNIVKLKRSNSLTELLPIMRDAKINQFKSQIEKILLGNLEEENYVNSIF